MRASRRFSWRRALACDVLSRAAVVAHVYSSTLVGIDAAVVEVECEVSRGLPFYNVVGLPAQSVREAAVRIRTALRAVGYDVPSKRVTVNLAPADLRKPSSALDLPITASVLIADGHPGEALDRLIVLGELGLDGTIRPVHGTLAAAMLARDRGLRGVVVPSSEVAEARLVEGIEVYGISHVRELIDVLTGRASFAAPPVAGDLSERSRFAIDMAEVRGQRMARAAIEIAVAGGHNLLLAGPPGTGKTMLARRIPTVLPGMMRAEALETTKIYSALGLSRGLVAERPFRAPHHSISSAALLGGGTLPHPGEISLAHNGVLFLDEMPEFARTAIEGLRQPLEERTVVVGRINRTLRFPASFLLVAAANPCPCGWLDSTVRECTCASGAIDRYKLRLSGPLLDRIDLHVFVEPVKLSVLRSSEPAESSASIRARVVAARERQGHRLRSWGLHCNAEMPSAVLRATCRLDAAGESELAHLVERNHAFTARSIDRVLKVARTIADLSDEPAITADHIAFAGSFRDVDPTAHVPDQPSRVA